MRVLLLILFPIFLQAQYQLSPWTYDMSIPKTDPAEFNEILGIGNYNQPVDFPWQEIRRNDLYLSVSFDTMLTVSDLVDDQLAQPLYDLYYILLKRGTPVAARGAIWQHLLNQGFRGDYKVDFIDRGVECAVASKETFPGLWHVSVALFFKERLSSIYHPVHIPLFSGEYRPIQVFKTELLPNLPHLSIGAVQIF